MSRARRVPSLAICLIPIGLLLTSAGVFASSYTEDFTSKQYCDTSNTTAWWDTTAGEAKLPPFELRSAGSYDTPNVAYGVAVSGDYAYVADHVSGLLVIDISDPTTPALAGSYNTTGYADEVVVSGDYAYVAGSFGGLWVIDISDPTTPALAGSYNPISDVSYVVVSGDYAYMAANDSLVVIDISDPTSPTFAGGYNAPDRVSEVTISGDYAYAAGWSAGLLVIDISDPTSPDSAGSYDTGDRAYGVAVWGDYAYVAEGLVGLQVIDISDPTNPVLAGSYDTPGYSLDGLVICGDHAYAGHPSQGLLAIDISDPTNPLHAGSYDAPGYVEDIAISGGHAHVAWGSSGLQVITVSNPVPPTLAGSHDTPSTAYGVAISGDYAYVADWGSGLQVIDISDPATPVSAGSYNTPGVAYGVAISGDHAYVADWGSGLQVIDISDPTGLATAGNYDTPGEAYDAAISGDYAYVADGMSGLLVIDISDPTIPDSAGSYNTPNTAYGVAVSGDYAYVADRSSGLLVVDISDPTTPVYAGSYNTPGWAYDVAISGDYAYVADHGGGLQVIDITDPTTPVLGGSYDTPGRAYGVAITGDCAYVADSDSGLQVIDISDPTMPALAGGYNTPGDASGVAIFGDHAFIGDGLSGLQVIEVFQRRFDLVSNTAWSLPVEESDKTVMGARLTSTQTDSIRWEVSADSGGSWQDLLPGGDYQDFGVPGVHPIWRSSHVYTSGGVNPACTDLEIQWLYESPVINSVTDIPNDQGKQVSLVWRRSGYDIVGSGTPITEYAVYRRIDYELSQAPSSSGQVKLGAGEAPLYPPGDWHFVTTVPARVEDEYAVVVPTLADSTIAEGMYYTTFFVSAMTATPGVYFDSYPDSGYSLDNLAPAPPPNLRMESATEVAWDECPDADFDYFAVYGSAADVLDPTATLIGYTSGMAMDVTDDQYHYYHVTATDFSGNEGDASSVENEYAGVSVERDLPVDFALKQNRPNPFGSSTRIAFDLPEPCAVRLEIVDVQGRVVRVLTDEAWPAGRHSVTWSGETATGGTTGPGIYFMRINAGDFAATRKILFMR
jgi:hypothetical protein